jgi:NAD(P)-dependent dehydrogenase (short-subunit alcohol dehydrogenase family)
VLAAQAPGSERADGHHLLFDLTSSTRHGPRPDDCEETDMTARLAGKTAVITGAASGIGEATARRFVEEGANVVIADLQHDAGAALADELGEAARFIGCDVTVEADVAAAVDLAVSEYGRLDIMFNNAGVIGVSGSIIETPVEAWDNTIAILLRGVYLGVKHAGRVMAPQGSGVILNTSSIAGVVGGLGPHAYTAAKHGVIGLTKSVANELAPLGIRVNAIAPGNTVSPMTATAVANDHEAIDEATERIAKWSPLGIAGMPEDIANAALYLASDEAKYVSGHTLVVDAGHTTSQIVPNRVHRGAAIQQLEAGRTE